MTTTAKHQHYLPQSYLRFFTDADGWIVMRRRGSKPVKTGVAVVAGEMELYTVILPDGTRDRSAEDTLSHFDGTAHAAFESLRSGRIPGPGTDERNAISVFLGLQLLRTPEQADRWMFASNVVTAVGGIDNVNRESVGTYLREQHLHFEPSEIEVIAATDLVHAEAHMGLPSKEQQLKMMFETAVETFGPLLDGLQWSLERCRRPLLATCDRLPAIWHEVRESESYMGSGLLDAEELWVPVDSSSLLVIRRGGSELVTDVEPKRFRFVNSHLARHCYSAVFHRLGGTDRSGEFRMARHRPSLRFSCGPRVDDQGNHLSGPRDILHQWVPVRDDLRPETPGNARRVNRG